MIHDTVFFDRLSEKKEEASQSARLFRDALKARVTS
jgi:hypothetical protein